MSFRKIIGKTLHQIGQGTMATAQICAITLTLCSFYSKVGKYVDL